MYKKAKCEGWPCYYIGYGKKGAPAIVFLHGYSDSAETFKPLKEELSKKYQVFIPDLPMVRRKGVVFDLEELASFLNDLVTKLKVKKFILCGFSFGGLVAAHFAYLYPKKVKKLYLLNSVPQFLAPEMIEKLLSKIEPEEIPKFFYPLLGILKNNFFGRFFVPKTERFEKSLKNMRKKSFSVFGTAYEVIRNNIIGGTFKERVRKFLKMPMSKTVVLFKDDGIIDYEKYAAKLKRAGVEVVSFSRGGHADRQEYWENIKSLF